MQEFYFSAKGRISRKQWWLRFVLPLIGLYLVIVVLAVGIIAALGEAGAIASILLLPVYIALIWTSVCVGAKRFHDRDMSGWWVLYFMLIGLGITAVQYGAIFLFGPDNVLGGIIAGVALLASLVVSIVQIVILGFLPGTKGPNQYGADPLDPTGGTAATFA
ncbi:MAG: DUF805 domain-containing protein [Pseudomonadota bacterium]